MRRDLLEAVMMAAMFGGKPPTKPRVRVVENPQHTRNLFGPVSEIAGKELRLLDRNDQGDCLCIFQGSKGTNIVDVDHRDVSQNDRTEAQPPENHKG
jgi:hypothetical protein